MIQKKFYKTIKVLVNGDGGETPFYIENIDTQVGTFRLDQGGEHWDSLNLMYRIDNGNWTEYDLKANNGVEVQPHQKIYLKGDNPYGFGNQPENVARFSLKNNDTHLRCNVGGYITSLLTSLNSKAITTIPDNAFAYLMGWHYENPNILHVVSARDLRTDNIKTVNNSGFKGLFQYNTNLVEAPSFSTVKTVLSDGFLAAFGNCSNLVIAPTFENVETAGNSAFCETFYLCTSLVVAPTFEKAISGTGAAFLDTFNGCTSLVTAPKFSMLTTLGENGGRRMFLGCTSLQVPPTFENFNSQGWYIFSEAFKDCTSLKTTPNFRNWIDGGNMYMLNEAFVNCTSLSTIYAPRCAEWRDEAAPNWVIGVAGTGTFYKRRGLEIPTGLNGIPNGWNVIEED